MPIAVWNCERRPGSSMGWFRKADLIFSAVILSASRSYTCPVRTQVDLLSASEATRTAPGELRSFLASVSACCCGLVPATNIWPSQCGTSGLPEQIE